MTEQFHHKLFQNCFISLLGLNFRNDTRWKRDESESAHTKLFDMRSKVTLRWVQRLKSIRLVILKLKKKSWHPQPWFKTKWTMWWRQSHSRRHLRSLFVLVSTRRKRKDVEKKWNLAQCPDASNKWPIWGYFWQSAVVDGELSVPPSPIADKWTAIAPTTWRRSCLHARPYLGKRTSCRSFWQHKIFCLSLSFSPCSSCLRPPPSSSFSPAFTATHTHTISRSRITFHKQRDQRMPFATTAPKKAYLHLFIKKRDSLRFFFDKKFPSFKTDDIFYCFGI